MSRKNVLVTGDINFLIRALPEFFSFMAIKQSFHFESINICRALPLCQALPRVNTSDCPFTDETDSLLAGRNTACQNNSGHKPAFGGPAYALQKNSTMEQWQQRSPAVTSHQQTIWRALSKREDGRAQTHISNKESSDGSIVKDGFWFKYFLITFSRTIWLITVWLMDSPPPPFLVKWVKGY